MSETYAFLRFQLAGVGFFVYWMLFLSPFISGSTAADLLSDGQRLVALVGLVFILSMPSGYVIHQFVVNRYRGPAHRRPVHDVLEAIILDCRAEILPGPSSARPTRFEVLDSLLPVMSRLPTAQIAQTATAEEAVLEKLDERWSHLYARLAIGTYSFFPAIAATAATVLLSLLPTTFPWQPLVMPLRGKLEVGTANVAVAGLLVALTFIFITLMNTYVHKLLTEIRVMESALLQLKRDQVRAALLKIDGPSITGPTRAAAHSQRLYLWIRGRLGRGGD